MPKPTNIQIANDLDTSSRQVSRCTRKYNPRGWLYLYKDREFDSNGKLRPRKLDLSRKFNITSARAHRREGVLDGS